MDVVALLSGGKDSCFNAAHCVANGHRIVALANLHPDLSAKSDEIDSFMYQTVGHNIIPLFAHCFYNPVNNNLPLPMFRRRIRPNITSLAANLSYSEDDHDDQVNDLYMLLQDVKQSLPNVKAVSVGAILSNYQRIRVEFVCHQLGLTVLAYLWESNQTDLLDSMIRNKMVSVLIKVAAMGLNASHLGKTLEETRPHLLNLNSKFDVHVCGEGGEYETLTLDCPLFRRRLVIQESQIIEHTADEFAPVMYLRCDRVIVEDKEQVPSYEELCRRLAQDLCDPLPVLTNIPRNLVPGIPRTFCNSFLKSDTMVLADKRPLCFKKVGDILTISAIRPLGAPVSLKDAVLCVMQQASAILNKNHLSICSDVLMVTIIVQCMSNFNEVNSLYSQFFKENPPARACVEVNLNCHIQLDLLARSSTCTQRSNLHVRSLSYWAPANIGPYSQAVSCKEHTYIAGQIGLVPQSMTFPQQDILTHACIMQAILARRHFERICLAVKCDAYTHTVATVAYVCDRQWINIAQQVWETNTFSDRDYLMSKNQVPSGILAVVVVPQLPRGAMVEYVSQLSKNEAFIIDQESDSNVGSVQLNSSLPAVAQTSLVRHKFFNMETRGLRHGYCVFAFCSIFLNDSETGVFFETLSFMLDRARTEIAGFLTNLRADMVSVLMVRAFVVGVGSDFETYNYALSQAFADCATCLVPVSEIKGGAMLLLSVHGCASDH